MAFLSPHHSWFDPLPSSSGFTAAGTGAGSVGSVTGGSTGGVTGLGAGLMKRGGDAMYLQCGAPERYILTPQCSSTDNCKN